MKVEPVFEATVGEWGSRPAVRIPKTWADATGAIKGTRIRVRIEAVFEDEECSCGYVNLTSIAGLRETLDQEAIICE